MKSEKPITKSEKLKTKSFGNLAVIFRFTRCVFFFSLFVFSFSLLTAAQSRDYFTDAEIEMIRDVQQIDKRIELLAKIIDRRFMLLNIEVNGTKPSGKDWGEPPKGTRVELFSDIHNILQKAADDIDNLAARPDSMVIDPNDKKPKKYSDLFPKAVRILAIAAERYKQPLAAALNSAKDEREKALISISNDLCNDITAAVHKL